MNSRAPGSGFRAWRGTVAFLVAMAATLSLCAHPSGGPYGPIQERYELPPASHTYVVAPDGKSDAPGTIDQPTTLEVAIAKVVSCDAIILRGGTYRTGGLRLNQGVTLQPYADEHPILKGTEVAKDWDSLPNGRWRTHWTKLFPARPADWWVPAHFAKESPLYLFNNDMVFIDGRLLGAVGSAQEVSANTYFIDYENADVTIGTNPENHVVEITAHDSALVRTFRDVHGKSNDHRGPVIRGLTFTQYAYRALEVEGIEPQKYSDPATFGKEVVGTVLENDTLSYCSRVAGYFRGDKLVIRHCLVSDCGSEGIYVINSADVLLEKNIITRTNRAEKLAGYYASAVKIFNQSYRPVVRDNLIIDNPDASGVWFDVGEVDAVFVDNWVEGTNNGFFFEISKGATCAGNVFVHCLPGSRVLNSSKVKLYQNTYFDSTAEFSRAERSAANDHFGWHPSAGPAVEDRHGHVFVNNLLAADASLAVPLVTFWQSEAVRQRMPNPQVDAMDGNVYVRQRGAKPVATISWGPVSTPTQAVDIFALDELRALHPEFEAKSRLYSDYWGPLFRSPELDRFDMLPGFPGANGGVTLPPEIQALLGMPSNQPPYPGAYLPAR